MPLTVNTKTYTQDLPLGPDAVPYNGPAHDDDTIDRIIAKRTAPKPTADFAGVGRSEVKLTRTGTDGTNDVGNMIVTINCSFPVDVQASEKELMLTDLAAWLASAEADSVLVTRTILQ